MADKEIVRTDAAPAPFEGAPYSQAVRYGDLLFVAGQLAGTLSPADMASRTDGSIAGGVRLADDDTIAAEFARYAETDPLCCPTGRVTVRYRIDRQAIPPVMVPVGVQPTRR